MMSAKLLSDEQVAQFLVDGYLVLKTDLNEDVHSAIDHRLREVTEQEFWHGNNVAARVPQLHEIVRCPTVHGAVTSLLGDGYLHHPHRAVHMNTPVQDPDLLLTDEMDAPPMGRGSTAGSGWHQDAQSPLARARHHLPRFLIGFYFPHHTPKTMGPTRLQAGSYWWPHPLRDVSGVVVPDDIPAGTFVLVHFDMVHAGFTNTSQQARFMVKFVFSRTRNPNQQASHIKDRPWRMPKSYRAEIVPDNALSFTWQWLSGQQPGRLTDGDLSALRGGDIQALLNATYAGHSIDALVEQLRRLKTPDGHLRHFLTDAKGHDIPRDDLTGYPRRWNERAVVMEPETYALAVQGEAAHPALIELLEADPWLQINALFALGESGCEESLPVVRQALHSPYQQVVRQAVEAIGMVGGDATQTLSEFSRLMTLERGQWRVPEVQRGWRAQDQIRLNIMFACVALLHTSTDTDGIEAVLTLGLLDQGYCAQVAVEGLRRIGSPAALEKALSYTADRSWDDTLLGRGKAY